MTNHGTWPYGEFALESHVPWFSLIENAWDVHGRHLRNRPVFPTTVVELALALWGGGEPSLKRRSENLSTVCAVGARLALEPIRGTHAILAHTLLSSRLLQHCCSTVVVLFIPNSQSVCSWCAFNLKSAKFSICIVKTNKCADSQLNQCAEIFAS